MGSSPNADEDRVVFSGEYHHSTVLRQKAKTGKPLIRPFSIKENILLINNVILRHNDKLQW